MNVSPPPLAIQRELMREQNQGQDQVPVSAQTQALLARAHAFTCAHFATHDSSHDMYHVDRVVAVALKLAKSENEARRRRGGGGGRGGGQEQGDGEGRDAVDTVVVHLAALFHDLCDDKYLLQHNVGQDASSSSPSSAGGAVTAATVLRKFWQDLPPDLAEVVSKEQKRLIERIVDGTSWSKDVKRTRRRKDLEASLSANTEGGQLAVGAKTQDGGKGGAKQGEELELIKAHQEWESECVEFWCVSDADRLDAIGGIGILRCAAYSCHVSRPLLLPSSSSSSPSSDSTSSTFAGGEGTKGGEGNNKGGDVMEHYTSKLSQMHSFPALRTEMARKEAVRRQQCMASLVEGLKREMEWAGL